MTDDVNIGPEPEEPEATQVEEPTPIVPAAPPPPPPPPPVPPPSEASPGEATPVEAVPIEQPSDSGKVLAVLGYIFPVVAAVALFIDPYRQEPFVRLHAVQAIALWLCGLLVWIPVIGWIIGVALFVVVVIALIKALQGEYYRIPFLYDLVKGFVEQ